MSNQYDPRYANHYAASPPQQQQQQQQPQPQQSYPPPLPGPAGALVAQPNQQPNQWTAQAGMSPPQYQHQHQYQQQQQQPGVVLQGSSTVPPGSQPVTGAYQHSPPQQQQQQQQHHQVVQSPQPVQTKAEDDDFFGAFSTKSGEDFPQEPSPRIQQQPREIRTRSHSHGGGSVGSRSTISTRSGHSAKSGSVSILDDKRYAPPPKYPKETLHMMKQQVFSNGNQHGSASSTLPSYDMVKHSGSITARISLKSLVIKKWKYVFWIAYGNNSLLFFRSKPDFEDWLVNPYLTKEGRDELVKLKVDFVNDLYITGMNGYKASTIRYKSYGKSGLLHQFKLEKWMAYGPTIVAAFASKNENDATELRTIMNEMIRASPQRNRVLGDDGDNDGGSRSGGSVYSYQSGRSGASGKSGVSGLQEKLSGLMGGKGDNKSTRSYGSAGSGRSGGGGGGGNNYHSGGEYDRNSPYGNSPRQYQY